MAQSWNIDPHSGDYVMEGGAPVQTDSLLVPAYFRLKTKRKRWMYAPDDKYGSDYYTVVKRPTTNASTRMEQIGADALQPIVDDGRAKSVTVEVTEANRNGFGLVTTIVDAAGEPEIETFRGLGTT